MGIIRFILLFFLPTVMFSQTLRDTVEFEGNKYVEHIVKAGESLKIIADLHNVKISDILNSNEMQKRLYYNQLLYIPVDFKNNISKKKLNSHLIEKEPDRKIKKSDVKIALLMPYYIVKNDTMFNDFIDTSKINSLYFNSSEIALSFHVGVTLALDSLRKIGYSITLYTFDTNNDAVKINQIINSGVLDKMDFIIGPLYAKNFNMLCKKYGNDKDKVIINPLSRLTNNVEEYNSVYQISPRVEDQLYVVKKRIISKYKSKRVLVLYQEKEKEYVQFLKRLFSKDNKRINIHNIEYTHIDSIRSIFTSYQVVIIPSIDKPFVSKLLASIRGMDSTSIVFGLDTWKKYDNLDIDDLMEINVHIPVSNPFDYSLDHVNDFVRLFRNKYNTNEGKYTFVGYSIIMNFFTDYNVFVFKKLLNGGRSNISTPLYHYYNYDLVPVD